MRSKIGPWLIVLAWTAHVDAASAAQRLQFDLVCNTRGHVAADPHPRFRGTGIQQTWRSHYRYVVDLRTRRFCEPWVCVNYGARTIVSANARMITLYDQPLATNANALVVTVRNSDGHYRLRQEADDGYTLLETGFCRRVRFSGFPAGTQSAAAMR